MQSKKYNKMFTISPIKRVFFNSETGETTYHPFNDRENLELRNDNIYDLKGNLVEAADQTQNNTLFLLYFDRINGSTGKEFLNFQYNKTPNKSTFLDYLEFSVYESEVVKSGVKTMMRKWIDEKREFENEQKNFQYYDEFVSRFSEFFDNVFYHFKSETLIAKDVENMHGIGLLALRLKNKLKIDFGKEGKAIERQINKIKSDFTILSQKIEKARKKHKFGHVDVIRRAEDLLNVAQVFWDTYDFVREYGIFDEKDIVLKKEIKGNDAKEIVEPKNPHKRIFVNGYSYQLFERLREEIISTKKTEYADYSFILPTMIKSDYLIETNHSKLINFLDKNYATTIGLKYNQFKTSETNAKKKTYSRLDKQFKPKIESIL